MRWLWVLVLVGWSTACGEPREVRGVYEEPLPIASDRAYAVRMTFFEFSTEVGGYFTYYAIDGERNRPENPYLVRESCAWFGPNARSNDEFFLSARGPEGGLMEGRARLEGSAERVRIHFFGPGGLWRPQAPPSAAFELQLQRRDLSADIDGCPPIAEEAGGLALPLVTTDVWGAP